MGFVSRQAAEPTSPSPAPRMDLKRKLEVMNGVASDALVLCNSASGSAELKKKLEEMRGLASDALALWESLFPGEF